MWSFNEVKTVNHLEGYRLYVAFDDGLAGELDLSEYLNKGPVFEPLRDLGFFSAVAISNGTISWPNGADIAPETLYEKLESLNRK